MTIGDINDRINLVRASSSLSQTDFSAKLGTTRGVITNLEFKNTSPNNSFVGVSLAWLQDGVGEMFLQRSANEELAIMVAQSDDSFCKRVISAFLAFPPEKTAVLEEFIDALAANKNSTGDT